ncbi:hypothetical protein KAF25_010312 [Fusarium avenaceum]|uniref:ARCA protein n=1 Tax=Fusarium avenaceum TaxID=40199 RepID=A0A9P7KP18_9HYPO|nr:hypothetical protein KAF25_010312 [Fusarium avenaceum]
MVSLIHSPYVARFFSSLHLTMAHSPIHDAVIPPSLFLEDNSPESKSSKDFDMSSPKSFLSDYSVGSPHGFASPLKTRREAFLLMNYLQELAPRIDLCDPSKRFGREVPKRARQLPLLAYSILAFSSRHQVLITGIDDESSEEYHSYALRILIPILDDPMSSLDENLLAAAVLLRLYEEMCDVDTGTHLAGSARLWNDIPDFIAQGGLSEAASWIMLRQNLHISLIKHEPMQVDLNKYRRSRSFINTTDEDFANRVILLCCQVLATSFDPGAQPDYATWAQLVMGYQHYCLARILLHISEPRLRVSSLGTIENRVAADKAASNDLRIAIGLGIHNPSVVGAGFTVHHILFTCGCLLTNPTEQQEVLNFIDEFGKSIGWPTHRLRKKLDAIWH